MRVQVLISCMFDSDYSVVKHTNLQSDAIVVNQCDHDSREIINITSKTGKKCCVTYINTTERGLSRSRNMAIRYSDCDICLLCDDDEVLYDDYVEKILNAYEQNPSLDVILFKFQNQNKFYPSVALKIGMWQCARITSHQISFKKSCKFGDVSFREDMGAGSGNGGGEENKFLVDLLKKKAKIYYFPIEIGSIIQNSNSTWFKGYTPKFHSDRGWAARQIYGWFGGAIYLTYSLLFRIKTYDKENSLFRILKWTISGYLEKR